MSKRVYFAGLLIDVALVITGYQIGLNQPFEPEEKTTHNITIKDGTGKIMASMFRASETDKPVFCVPSELPAYDEVCASNISELPPRGQEIARVLEILTPRL